MLSAAGGRLHAPRSRCHPGRETCPSVEASVPRSLPQSSSTGHVTVGHGFCCPVNAPRVPCVHPHTGDHT